jgi:sec-independent protein translocase protein TatB
MFDIGPMDMLVLAVVGILVFGPERLPGLARDAARMIRTGRELLIGTRSQLRDELGPEFANFAGSDLDLRKSLSQLLAGDPHPAPVPAPAIELRKPELVAKPVAVRAPDTEPWRPLPYPRPAA